jgi:hypothetical protein
VLQGEGAHQDKIADVLSARRGSPFAENLLLDFLQYSAQQESIQTERTKYENSIHSSHKNRSSLASRVSF